MEKVSNFITYFIGLTLFKLMSMSISLNKSQTSGNKKKNKIKIEAWPMYGFVHDKKIMRGSDLMFLEVDLWFV